MLVRRNEYFAYILWNANWFEIWIRLLTYYSFRPTINFLDIFLSQLLILCLTKDACPSNIEFRTHLSIFWNMDLSSSLSSSFAYLSMFIDVFYLAITDSLSTKRCFFVIMNISHTYCGMRIHFKYEFDLLLIFHFAHLSVL